MGGRGEFQKKWFFILSGFEKYGRIEIENFGVNWMDDNRVAVLIEDLRGQFRVFGEGLQIINDKVDNMDKKIDTLEQRMGSLELKVIGLDHKLDEHITVNHQEHMQLMQMIKATDSDLQTMKRIK